MLNCPLSSLSAAVRRPLVFLFWFLFWLWSLVSPVRWLLQLRYMRQKPQTQVQKTQGPFHGVIPEDWKYQANLLCSLYFSVFLCLFCIWCPGFLVVLSRRNRQKYCSILLLIDLIKIRTVIKNLVKPYFPLFDKVLLIILLRTCISSMYTHILL